MKPKPVYLEMWIGSTFVGSRKVDTTPLNSPRDIQDYYTRLADLLAQENDAFIKAILKQSPPGTRTTCYVTLPSAMNQPVKQNREYLQKAA